MWMRADHAISVEPGVVNAHFDQAPQPALGCQLLDIALAYTGGDAGDESVTPAVLDSFQRLIENVEPPAALVTDNRRAFHADQRRHIADLAQLARHLICDELAIGEDL